MAFTKRDSTPAPEPNEDGRQELHEAAVKAVESQHGPFAKRSPNYNELITDAKNQIQKAIEDNKTF